MNHEEQTSKPLSESATKTDDAGLPVSTRHLSDAESPLEPAVGQVKELPTLLIRVLVSCPFLMALPYRRHLEAAEEPATVLALPNQRLYDWEPPPPPPPVQILLDISAVLLPLFFFFLGIT